jgi:asparagine synthase (glutamine-hydrolysing)
MVEAMHHRGPDDQGQEGFDFFEFGATRLAIQDISAAGHQPMANDAKTVWVAYNGELYNAPTRRDELEKTGQRFFSNSDTEVVLRLYERYGENCLNMLDGIFALAIYDLRDNPQNPKVLLARDHLGVKPLLFYRGDRVLIFASEMKALLASGMVPRRLNPEAFSNLLYYGSVTQPHTMIRDVQMLPPAHLMKIEDGRVSVRRYWRLATDRRSDLSALNYQEQVAALGSLLDETVRSQMIADVPVGAFLSGGVDSATLVAIMARAGSSPIKTFSLGHADAAGAEPSELPMAAKFADHLGTDHHEIRVTGKQVLDDFDNIVDAMDQPSVDGLNTYLVSKQAAKEVKVVISGTGGDDLFMGYPWHASMLASQGRAENFLDEYDVESSKFHSTFSDQESWAVINPVLHPVLDRHPKKMLLHIDELPNADPVERLTALTLRGYTANQLLRDIDAMSMAHALEVRVPYLDRRIVDASLSLPVHSKIAREVPKNPMEQSYREAGIKKILIDIARPYLPEDFDNVKKQGFGMPLKQWTQGPLRDLVLESFSPERIARVGIYDPKTMEMVRSHFHRERLGGFRTWLLLVTQHWLERMQVTLD